MAVYEIRSEEIEGFPIVERIEVRPWRLGGQSHQNFVIGSGANFDAHFTVLVEIIYSVNDEPLFYTRNFLHSFGNLTGDSREQWLERFVNGENEGYGFGDVLPESSVFLMREKITRTTPEGNEEVYVNYWLTITADIGAVFSMSSPGMRQIEIKIDVDEFEPALEFMRQFTAEVEQVANGAHPDPATLAPRASRWGFSRAVNRKAYDSLALEYQEWQIADSLFKDAFDAWIGRIPKDGKILDIGCGFGKPVIPYLLEKGFAVTGLDASPKMLERVRDAFPSVPLINLPVEDLNIEQEFDAACSLSSMLYLDPIDFSHGLYRVYLALKPGGLLFLNAYDLHPTWRGEPYRVDVNRLMWGWSYGSDEVVLALEEHGYFKALDVRNVTPKEYEQEQLDKWFASATKTHEEILKKNPSYDGPAPDRNRPPPFPMQYTVVAQRLVK